MEIDDSEVVLKESEEKLKENSDICQKQEKTEGQSYDKRGGARARFRQVVR